MNDPTPGPWRYQGELTRTPGYPDRMRYEVYTASGKYGHPATCDRLGDARLIAAAPQLLEALKEIADYKYDEIGCCPRDCKCHPCIAKTAIAAAEGGGE